MLSLAGWYRIAKLAWVRWLVLGSAPLVGLGLIMATYLAVSGIRSPHRTGADAAGAADRADATCSAGAFPAFAEAGAEGDAPSRLARRWLPDRTALVFSVCEAQLARAAGDGQVP